MDEEDEPGVGSASTLPPPPPAVVPPVVVPEARFEDDTETPVDAATAVDPVGTGSASAAAALGFLQPKPPALALAPMSSGA